MTSFGFLNELMEFYVYTVFFTFIFYVMILAGSDQEVEIHLSFRGVELPPVLAVFLPVINLILMIYEWIIILQIFKRRLNK